VPCSHVDATKLSSFSRVGRREMNRRRSAGVANRKV